MSGPKSGDHEQFSKALSSDGVSVNAESSRWGQSLILVEPVIYHTLLESPITCPRPGACYVKVNDEEENLVPGCDGLALSTTVINTGPPRGPPSFGLGCWVLNTLEPAPSAILRG